MNLEELWYHFPSLHLLVRSHRDSGRKTADADGGKTTRIFTAVLISIMLGDGLWIMSRLDLRMTSENPAMGGSTTKY